MTAIIRYSAAFLVGLLLGAFISACGTHDERKDERSEEQLCGIHYLASGPIIRCPDGKEYPFPVLAGPAGADGRDGQDGLDGEPGEQGPVGPAGPMGTSCSVQPAEGGALIQCGEHTVLLTNGLDGKDGTDGQDGADGKDGQDAPPTPYTVTEMINPCGDAPGYDEVLLRLANGQLIAHYSSGNRQFLTVLAPGTFRTTDGTNCTFTVHPDMQVTW